MSHADWPRSVETTDETSEFGSLAHLVDEHLPTPLYHQVYLILRNKILSGIFGFNHTVPGEQEAAKLFGVSRITAKRALNELADEGIVKRERGRGTRVTYRAPTPPINANVEGLIENLVAMGLETQVDLLSFEYVRANPVVAHALKCGRGCCVQKAIRVRYLEGEPFSHLTTHVPETIGKSYDRDDLATRPLLSLLERSGVKIGRAEQTFSAELADLYVSQTLGVEVNSPLLSIHRTVFDDEGQPVEYISALYRPDRYKHRMKLSRIGLEKSRSWSLAEQ